LSFVEQEAELLNMAVNVTSHRKIRKIKKIHEDSHIEYDTL